MPLDLALVELGFATLLCGAIGLEREWRQKTAGLRTHWLVGLGSCLYTLLSLHAFGAVDPSRVAAQIVTGIGFVGGGAILRQGLSVRGLTTAATLWTVGAIGMACGTGSFATATVVTLIALLGLILFDALESRLPLIPQPLVVQIRVGVRPGVEIAARECMEELADRTLRGGFERQGPDLVRIWRVLRYKPKRREAGLQETIAALEALPGVVELSWETLKAAS